MLLNKKISDGSFFIFIESSSSLPTQIASINIIDQQRAGTIFAVTELPVQNLHYIEAGV